MPMRMVRTICLIIALAVFGWVAPTARAETFKLVNGETITGEVLVDSANDVGVQVKLGEGKYERVPWANFSQEDLKTFAKSPKMEPYVEPFIEVTQAEKIKKTEVNIKQPQRLTRPAPTSLPAALFSSSLGLFLLLLIYAGNLYAAYEVSIFRARPAGLVCGVSAVLPFIGPIIFLCLPAQVVQAQETWEPVAAAAAHAATPDTVNPMQAEGAVHPTALHLAGSGATDAAKTGPLEGGRGKPELPPTTTYQRGQFTFNRRFIETKFPGFFGVVRRDADRDMVLVIKSSRGEYTGQQISRIAANDLHLLVQRGHASEEVMIPFVEIQEIRLKHKDAK